MSWSLASYNRARHQHKASLKEVVDLRARLARAVELLRLVDRAALVQARGRRAGAGGWTMSTGPGPWSNFYDARTRRLRVQLADEASVYFEVWDRNVYSPDEPPGEHPHNIEVTGSIRFDGCANMSADCIHTCDLEQVADIALAIRGAYALAATMIEDYCGDVVALELSEEAKR
jgi:hypothetical protein